MARGYLMPIIYFVSSSSPDESTITILASG